MIHSDNNGIENLISIIHNNDSRLSTEIFTCVVAHLIDLKLGT